MGRKVLVRAGCTRTFGRVHGARVIDLCNCKHAAAGGAYLELPPILEGYTGKLVVNNRTGAAHAGEIMLDHEGLDYPQSDDCEHHACGLDLDYQFNWMGIDYRSE